MPPMPFLALRRRCRRSVPPLPPLLAQKGIFITIIDYSQDKGKQVESLAEKEVRKFHGDLKFPQVLFIKCDVSNSKKLAAALEKYVEAYGGMDICINCAGIATPISFYKDQTDGSKSWRRAVDINFVAVIESTRIATKFRRRPCLEMWEKHSEYHSALGLSGWLF